MKLRLLCALLLIAVCSPAFADGSLATRDVLPLLKQNLALFSLLNDTLEFSPDAVARRIGHVGNDRLSGVRVAPYQFEARPKGSSGPWVFIITVEAETTYLDEKGKETSLYEASSYVESLLGVKIEPNKPQQRNASTSSVPNFEAPARRG